MLQFQQQQKVFKCRQYRNVMVLKRLYVYYLRWCAFASNEVSIYIQASNIKINPTLSIAFTSKCICWSLLLMPRTNVYCIYIYGQVQGIQTYNSLPTTTNIFSFCISDNGF